MKSLSKIICICLLVFLQSSCDEVPNIKFLEDNIEVDYRAQEVLLRTNDVIFWICTDWLITSGCTEPVISDDWDYFEGEWFKVRVDTVTYNTVFAELTENDTGQKRQLHIVAMMQGFSAAANVIQLPKE